ncbi:MAG: [FeFe] hydrogenase H-cluster maturation GTPase HydF [Phycisphaerae bacterium]
MVKTPKGLRLHIGVFGRRNVGKSSLLNAFVKQNVSIVSDVAGTTTDPVEKVMELKPIGPVVFIDTAGIDDVGALGNERISKTHKVIERTDLAILVTDKWTNYEDELLAIFKKRNIPHFVAANKQDLRQDNSVELQASAAGAGFVVSTNALNGAGIDRLRETVIAVTPNDFIESAPVISDLVKPKDIVVLVTPIDIEAPKGRLKMLQVHCMREILDKGAAAIITKETELADLMDSLAVSPSLVVCDSQVFDKVAAIVDDTVPVTTFSILMARFKGDLDEMIQAVKTIDKLRNGDSILIAEACTHHPIGEDIGRVQIPNLLEKAVGGKLNIDVLAGHDFPEDISEYKLIIHCGACVFNRKEMLWRIDKAKNASVPITNYGLTIVYCLGLLERAIAPFEKARIDLSCTVA